MKERDKKRDKRIVATAIALSSTRAKRTKNKKGNCRIGISTFWGLWEWGLWENPWNSSPDSDIYFCVETAHFLATSRLYCMLATATGLYA